MFFSEDLESFICGSNQEISTWKLFFQKVWIVMNIFYIYDVFIRWILFEIEPFEIAHETHFFRWKSPKMMAVRVTGIYSSENHAYLKNVSKRLFDDLYYCILLLEIDYKELWEKNEHVILINLCSRFWNGFHLHS